MTEALTSRRKLIVSGFMTWACVWLPARGLPGGDTPVWLNEVSRSLASLSTWMRTEFEENGNGDVVIHCGARDLSSWARHAGALAGKHRKVMAHGNTLTFRLPERQVRVVIHPDLA